MLELWRINQFPPNIVRSIRQFERINKKYVDKKFLLCSIKYVSMKKCPQYIYIYIYIYIRGGDGTSATRARHDQ